MSAELSKAKRAFSALLVPIAVCLALSAIAGATIAWSFVSSEVGDDYLKFDIVEGDQVSSLDWLQIGVGAVGLAVPIFAVLAGLVVLAYTSRRDR